MGAVVDALPVDNAIVVAGGSGMRRLVRRARVVASSDDLLSPAAGELVVTTAANLVATAEDPERLVAGLDAADVAGLAVRLDPTVRLPPELRPRRTNSGCQSSP